MNSQPYISQRRATKQKKTRKLRGLLFFFFILLAVIAYFQSPIGKVTKIEVNGIQLLQEKEVLEKADLQLNMPYFFIRTSTIEERLLELGEVKKVEVRKQFPGKLIIEITENKPVSFLYQPEGNWAALLENGVLVAGNSFMLDRPLITKWTDENKLTQLAEELTKLHPSVLERISEIQTNPDLSDKNRLLLYTREGYRVHISLTDLGKKFGLYPSIIENLKEKNDKLGDLYLFESMRFEEFKNEDTEKER